jgi:ADP-ribose pyrophosphatase YjhB (NUDIX family)
MNRTIRYQGAIMRDGHILLVRHRYADGYEYWGIPGGGRKADETEEQCVIREVKEETNLDIKIEQLLIDGPSHPHSCYQRFKTYLCTPIGDQAQPGHESGRRAIVQVEWFDLSDKSQLGLETVNNTITYAVLQRIREALGYT